MGAMSGRFWEEKPLEAMTRAEWESLCDGCGKCCVHKLEDEDTGALVPTNVACRLLDRRAGRCSDYRRRHAFVPACVRLTPAKARTRSTATGSPGAATRRRATGARLYDWHPLVSGDPESVHRAGMSTRGWTVSEDDAGDLENHVVERDI